MRAHKPQMLRNQFVKCLDFFHNQTGTDDGYVGGVRHLAGSLSMGNKADGPKKLYCTALLVFYANRIFKMMSIPSRI